MLDQNIRVRPPNKAVLEWKLKYCLPIAGLSGSFVFATFGIAMTINSGHRWTELFAHPYVYIFLTVLTLSTVGFRWSFKVPNVYEYWYGDIVGGKIIELTYKEYQNNGCRFIAVVKGQNRAGETITDDIPVEYTLWRRLAVGLSFPVTS